MNTGAGITQRCVAELRARPTSDPLALHLFATLAHLLRLVPPDILTQLLTPVTSSFCVSH
jgi:hypothetical protein